MIDTDELVWASALILVIPLVVVLFGELAERLRQRESPLAAPVGLLRTWVLPLGVAYALVRILLIREADAVVSRIVATAAVLAAAITAIAALRVLTDRLRHRAPHDPRRRPPQLLLMFPRLLVVLVTGWVLLSDVWGVSVSNAFTALGVTTLIVSLALQSTLGGLASGLLLLADQPFRPGEWVRVDDLEGQVVDVNWRSTRLRDRDGDLLIVPNSSLATATLVNYDQPERLHRITLEVQVAFSNPPSRAIEMLLSAARSTPGVLTEPAPDVKITSIDDPLMTYAVQVWIDDHAITPRVHSELASLVWYWSERLGVGLPSPAHDVYLWDGPTAAADRLVGTDRVRHLLETSPLLATLPVDELDRLAAAGRYQRFAAGERIVPPPLDELERDQHRPPDLHVLADGRASLVVDVAGGGRHTAAELTAGELFGFDHHADGEDARHDTTRHDTTRHDTTRHDTARHARHDDAARSAVQVVAVTDCEVVVIDGTTAEIVLGRDPGLAEAVSQLAASRSRRIARLIRDARPDRDARPNREGGHVPDRPALPDQRRADR